MNMATDLNQSRVLSGLIDPATADMTYYLFSDGKISLVVQIGERPVGPSFLPAWSLDKLVELMCCNPNDDVIFSRTTNGCWTCHWRRMADGIKTIMARMGKTKVEAASIALYDLIKSGEIKIRCKQ